jgi:magnesium-protoporphyrin O-methyltransferase
MSCCAGDKCSGAKRFFTRWSKSYAKQQRKKGLEKVQQLLLEGIERVPVSSGEVLDIGCGVGAVHLALLQKGALRATGIDAAPGMIKEARNLARERGFMDRVEHVVGDFVQVASDIAPADITVLDKVVCCYEQLESLIEQSARKTRRVYALSWPRDRFYVRWGFKSQIAILKLFRAAFHPFWHNWGHLHRMMHERGFRPVFENDTLLWSVAVFERMGPVPS